MIAVIERPTVQDQRVTQESLPGFTSAMARQQSDQIRIQVQADPVSVVVPAKAMHLLAVILATMADGKAVSVVPSDAEVSTQQAAELCWMLVYCIRPQYGIYCFIWLILVCLRPDGRMTFSRSGSETCC